MITIENSPRAQSLECENLGQFLSLNWMFDFGQVAKIFKPQFTQFKKQTTINTGDCCED